MPLSKQIMQKNHLQSEILKLLKISSVPQHEKNMLETLLPVMETSTLNKLHSTLIKERDSMNKLNEKQKRIELKYQVMVEKLVKMQNK